MSPIRRSWQKDIDWAEAERQSAHAGWESGKDHDQLLVVDHPEPLKWSELIFRHEMSTIAWARTKESDPQFKALHKAFLETGLALDEYVQKLRNPNDR